MDNLSLLILFIIGVTPCVGDAVFSPSVIQICYYKIVGKSPSNAAMLPNAYGVEQFRILCRNYSKYLNCLSEGIGNSDEEQDMFVNLIFQNSTMHVSYRGICDDINELAKGTKCLAITSNLRTCYNQFADKLSKMMETFSAPLPTKAISPAIKSTACNVTVTRYRCELHIYKRCSPRIGQIMGNFLYGALPTRCQRQTGVTSEYTLRYAKSNVNVVSCSWPVVLLCVIVPLKSLYYTTLQ